MVNIPKMFRDDIDSTQTQLPLLPLRDIVVFPHMVAPLFVGRTKSVNALSDAMGKNKRVFLATQIKAGVDSPEENDINRVGTIGKVLQLLKLPDGTVKALVEGEARAKVVQFLEEEDFFKVALEPLPALPVDDIEAKALCRSVFEGFEEYDPIGPFRTEHRFHRCILINRGPGDIKGIDPHQVVPQLL